MIKQNSTKDIFEEILKIFSSIIEKMKDIFDFFNAGIAQINLCKKFQNIDFQKEKEFSFETNDFYIFLIKKIYFFLQPSNKVFFHSSYSVLYLKRIFLYLTELKNLNIYEDNLIKLFFYFLILFFEENILNLKDSNLKIDLDESFFKGTFLELKEKYSSQVPYKDSEEINNFINIFKERMKLQIISKLYENFEYIDLMIREHGNQKDAFIINMHTSVKRILNEFDKIIKDKNLSPELLNKLNKFYSNEKYLTFINYISEKDLEDLEYNIDEKFINKSIEEYSTIKYDYSFVNNSTILDTHEKKLDNFLNQRNINYQRMKYSWFPEIFKFGLENESTIFAFSLYTIPEELRHIQKFKMKLENLEQKNIIAMIKEILYENDFYEHFFSILKSDIIKEFFSSYVIIDENEKKFKFKVQKEKSEGSENFHKAYSFFMNTYDKKDKNYEDFKNLILVKILPYGDRAYTLKHFKKIAINPAQFFIGDDLKEDSDIKIVLKGYLIIILLHETEHFLRLLDNTKDKNVYSSTPRQLEGGRLFIKHLLDVYSINHINLEQANKILNINTWKDHNELKSIFTGQLEDVEEEKKENIDEFILNYFKNSISYFAKGKDKENDKKKKFNLNDHLKK